MEEDNIFEETVEFSQELYEKNIAENSLDIEYEGGDIKDANN
jgi:hypothetical protein